MTTTSSTVFDSNAHTKGKEENHKASSQMIRILGFSLILCHALTLVHHSCEGFGFSHLNQSSKQTIIGFRLVESDQISSHLTSQDSIERRSPSAFRATYLKAKKQAQEIKGNKDVWQTFFNQLLQFQKANGHCNISEDDPYNQDLLIWVKDQKKQYEMMKSGRKVKITRKRAAALEQIGLVNPIK